VSGSCFYPAVVAVISVHTIESPAGSIQTDRVAATVFSAFISNLSRFKARTERYVIFAVINIAPSRYRKRQHTHWMSHYEKIMVTPNGLTGDATQYKFAKNSIEAILPVSDPLSHSLATEMMPDAGKFYVTNLLDITITAVDMKTYHVIKHINLIEYYDPIVGVISGPVGALPIQTPVSPDGKNMVTANTLTGTITIVDTRPGLATADEVVAILPCDPVCHGVQYGANKGGGYYAYVSSKFSNRLLVVDLDPNGDGNPTDVAVIGKVGVFAEKSTVIGDTITGNPGMGKQAILPTPIIYNMVGYKIYKITGLMNFRSNKEIQSISTKCYKCVTNITAF